MKPVDYLMLDGFAGMTRSATIVVIAGIALIKPVTVVFVVGLIIGVTGFLTSLNEYKTSLSLLRKSNEQ